jgi:phage terminase large subunit
LSVSVQLRIPDKLVPVFEGEADVRGAWGGRGSAKTRTFAKMVAVKGYIFGNAGIPGLLVCGRQFMNSLADSSLEECKRAIEEEPFLAAYYEIGENYIKSRDGRITFVFVGLDRNIASIKSKGRVLILWVDEAEPVVDEAWTTVIPTLREEGEEWNAELWVTWNPKRKGSATDKRFRGEAANDPRIKIVEMNWRDNPWFPAKLERDRQRDLKDRPDQVAHIWEGDYVSVIEGAYFARDLLLAKQQGRIGNVGADPNLTLRVFCDLGGTGARADAFSMWVEQFVGREIRVLDHYTAQGQPLSTHLAWLRERGYTPGRASIWLPHDGDTNDRIHDVSFRSAFEAAGYAVEVVPNQGKGAAKLRVEATRRLFSLMWFNASTTEAGRTALGWYHEKIDQDRGVGLGPEHDWSSHDADSFGLGCVVYEQPQPAAAAPLVYRNRVTS